ncbi:MAG: hypothetical protein RQ754_12670 [Desulfuromonadales bacterium]|nr:hypothetical protein [Desulfuromonadales bacterium]
MRLSYIGLLLILLLSLGHRQAGATEIAIAPLAAEGTPKALATEYLKRLLEERSSSRIRVRLVPDSEISSGQLLEALSTNRIQLALPETRSTRTLLPLLQIYEVPFLLRDRQQLHQVLDGNIGERILQQSTGQQLKPLAIWDGTSRQLLAERPLTGPDNSVDRLFQGRQSGVDMAEQTWREVKLSDMARMKTDSRTSTLTLTHHSTVNSVLLTSLQFWERLPEDLKIILSGAVKDATDYARELAEQADQKALVALAGRPEVKLYHLPPAERSLWQKKFRQLYPEQLDKVKSSFAGMIIRD